MFVSILLLVVEAVLLASATVSPIKGSVRAARNDESATPRFCENSFIPKPASISDATTQMDHNAVVLFTID